MEKAILTILVVFATVILFIVEQIKFKQFVNRSNNDVKKSEVYCDLIIFKAKYDLLPNKKRLINHPKIKQVLDNIYEMDETLSIHMNFKKIKYKCKNKVTIKSLKDTVDLLDNREAADDDIKELFKEAMSINENLVKLYSNKLYIWTYYTTKIQVSCIILYIEMYLFMANHVPVVQNKSIKKVYSNKDELIVDSVMCTKFC